jgi:hypothetical protein
VLLTKPIKPFTVLPLKKALIKFEPMKFKVIVNNRFFALGANIKQWGRFEKARSNENTSLSDALSSLK